MRLDFIDFEEDQEKNIEVSDKIFSVIPRSDIIYRVVRWQLARNQAGTHKTKNRSEVSYSTKKIVRQKGSGGARHGSRGGVQFRHGGTTKGPVVRSHAHKLPKKVRKLGLIHALSSKAQSSSIKVIENIDFDSLNTSSIAKRLLRFSSKKILIVVSSETPEIFYRSIRNINNTDILLVEGINVHDLIRSDIVILTSDVVKKLEERLQ